jgi:hypothetical protein
MSVAHSAVPTVAVRIRFAGTPETETFHITPPEFARFYRDWKSYLEGAGTIGGSYASEEAEHPLTVSLNFSQIAYIEPGKVY